MTYYNDIREFIAELEKNNKIIRIDRAINKDTELMPLVRVQFRGLSEEERKGFLFKNVVDFNGKKYEGYVCTSLLSSIDNYAIGLRCKKREIRDRWLNALSRPIEPEIVDIGPCKEEIHKGDELLEHDGLLEFPIPISTPGFDPAPFITAPCWITKDPETGIRNVGTYRAMVKGKLITGIQLFPTQHIGIHWGKHKAKGLKTMEAAIVIAPPPNVLMVSVAKMPYGVDEFTVAGGLVGESVKLVKCETVDLEVPATSEIVLEGQITIDYKEPEGPFGEYLGYMGKRSLHPIFKIKCITHRKKPIYYGFISQMPPSESSIVRNISYEAIMFQFLTKHCNIPGILDVHLPQIGQGQICIVKIRKLNQFQPQQVLNMVSSFDPLIGKISICIDEDIDPRDMESVLWTLYTRVMPHLDITIAKGRPAILDPSSASPIAPEEEQIYPKPRGSSVLLIDATKKYVYPPISLPKKEFMEKAVQLWYELGLPKVELREPWYGYELGYWPHEYEEDAEMAVRRKEGDKNLCS